VLRSPMQRLGIYTPGSTDARIGEDAALVTGAYAMAKQVPTIMDRVGNWWNSLWSEPKSSPLPEASAPLSPNQYEALRRQTPNQEVRDMVNPDGPKVDPVYGYSVDRFEADHIVPMKELVEMPGFTDLSAAKQVEVLNLPENFSGLGKSSNASKGASSWADWPGHSELGPVPPDVRAAMVQRDQQARVALQRAITERLGK